MLPVFFLLGCWSIRKLPRSEHLFTTLPLAWKAGGVCTGGRRSPCRGAVLAQWPWWEPPSWGVTSQEALLLQRVEAGSGHACLWHFHAVSAEALTRLPRSRPCRQVAAGSPGMRRDILSGCLERGGRGGLGSLLRQVHRPGLTWLFWEPGLALWSLSTPLGWAGTGVWAPGVRSPMEVRAGRPVPALPRPGSLEGPRWWLHLPDSNAVSTLVGTWGLPATPPNTQSVFKPVGQTGTGCSLWAVGWQDLVARGEGGVGSGSGRFLAGQRGSESPSASPGVGEGRGGEDSGQERPGRKIWGVGAELGFLWGARGCGGSRTRSDSRASIRLFWRPPINQAQGTQPPRPPCLLMSSPRSGHGPLPRDDPQDPTTPPTARLSLPFPSVPATLPPPGSLPGRAPLLWGPPSQ